MEIRGGRRVGRCVWRVKTIKKYRQDKPIEGRVAKSGSKQMAMADGGS